MRRRSTTGPAIRTRTPRRQPYGDNHRRFALLGWAAAQLARGPRPRLAARDRARARLARRPGAGLPGLRAAATGGRRVGSVFTVHNLAYQGLFPPWHFAELGLPPAAFGVDGLEFYGQVSFMKGGLCFADRITTVSPTYAREIQTPEQGCGLDGLLRSPVAACSAASSTRVDDQVWNPATDALIAHRYDARRLGGKAHCKAALQEELGLAPQADAPLFVRGQPADRAEGPAPRARTGSTRCWPRAASWPCSAAAMPTLRGGLPPARRRRAASRSRHARLQRAARPPPVRRRRRDAGAVAVRALRPDADVRPAYGSLPLVHRVGGLADTVVDATLEDMASGDATGFSFDDFDAAGLRTRAAPRLRALPAPGRLARRSRERHEPPRRLGHRRRALPRRLRRGPGPDVHPSNRPPLPP